MVNKNLVKGDADFADVGCCDEEDNGRIITFELRDGFMLDIVNFRDMLDAVIYHKDCNVKQIILEYPTELVAEQLRIYGPEYGYVKRSPEDLVSLMALSKIFEGESNLLEEYAEEYM